MEITIGRARSCVCARAHRWRRVDRKHGRPGPVFKPRPLWPPDSRSRRVNKSPARKTIHRPYPYGFPGRRRLNVKNALSDARNHTNNRYYFSRYDDSMITTYSVRYNVCNDNLSFLRGVGGGGKYYFFTIKRTVVNVKITRTTNQCFWSTKCIYNVRWQLKHIRWSNSTVNSQF